jgi:hypothetical protein
MASVKGKTTRRKPTPVVEVVVSLPVSLINAQRNVKLNVDTLFVNGMTPNVKASYSAQLETVFAFCMRAGFRVTLVAPIKSASLPSR